MSSIQTVSFDRPLPFSAPVSSNPFEKNVGQQSPERVAADFESVFTSMMLKEMRKTLENGSLFGEDQSDIYGGMFDQFMGQHMSNAGGIGLASMVRQAVERTANAERMMMGLPQIAPQSDVTEIAN